MSAAPIPIGCPFCDGHPECVRTSAATWIRCGDCCAEGPVIHSPAADWDAIEAWNRREVEDDLRRAIDSLTKPPLRCMGCGKTIAEHGPLLNCRPSIPADRRAASVARLDERRRRRWTPAARDVLAERQRQVSVEGWTPDHDDEHDDGALARAAAAYAVQAELDGGKVGEWRAPRLLDAIRELWPWELAWWKPKDRRSNLVRAGALILAEIERLDRAAQKGGVL